MYATKQPTLRIKQADLECKNECGFFGNAEWEGYCSKCYRNCIQKERAAKKSSTESSKSSINDFSKFKEKKLQQSDKKNKYLKPVFRKSLNSKDTNKLESRRNFRHAPEFEKLTAEFIKSYEVWGEGVRKHFLKCVDVALSKISNEVDNKPIEDIAELVQTYYKLYAQHLNNDKIYEHIHSDIRDQLLEYFEKFLMTVLYSLLFCPHSTNDEEKDLTIQNRIRKLRWVTAHHLGCCISETSIEVRDLVYTAITDLLGMDSVKAPQEKLACVVHCCRSVMKVLQHCQGGPVSADEFLPALIFIVLKGNPTRLKSNIHYVTRFCNDSRLMQGEGGYYFTNLCCAVSFIENLTAESLAMSDEEFKAYMAGVITPVSAWESALVACESMHQIHEHLALLDDLSKRSDTVQRSTAELKENVNKFKTEITKKVADVLSKTPLIIKPRKSEIKFDYKKSNLFDDIQQAEIKPTIVAKLLDDDEISSIISTNIFHQSNVPSYYQQNIQTQSSNIGSNKQKSNLLHLDVSPCLQLSNSPGCESNKSLDTTPDYPNGNSLELSGINYDIDFSDLSGDNSMADDLTPEKRSPLFTPDPFSPIENIPNVLQTPLMPSNVINDFESDVPSTATKVFETILDKQEELSFASLPSPLQPTASQYTEFSKHGWQIPNIPCNTGDYYSLEPLIPTSSKTKNDVSSTNPSTSVTNIVQSETNVTLLD